MKIVSNIYTAIRDGKRQQGIIVYKHETYDLDVLLLSKTKL